MSMSVKPPETSPMVLIDDARVPINRRRTLTIERFAIRPGEHWCVLGGNGAGKTALVNLLRGELVRGRQHVSYAEGFDPVTDLDTVSFEEQQRLWSLDDRHDISEYSAEAKDQGTTVARLMSPPANPALLQMPEVQEMLSALELSELLERGIRYLSSGQVRKAMIARALLRKQAARSRLLILDDPLEAIDRQAQPVVRSFLQQWMDKNNATLLLSRRVSEVLPGITHLAIMEDLKIIEQGPAEQVYDSEAFLRIANPQVNVDTEIPCQLETDGNSPERPPPIRLNKVSAFYGDKPVLVDVTWLMDIHHHTLIEGPNGCGKSTLLSLIDGENHKAYGQEVYLFGVRRGSGESVWDIKSHFGVVSNEIHNKYVKGWRVLDVVVSGFYDSVGLYDDSGASQIDVAKRWLSCFSMELLARDYFHEISFGQQRLILLARAMVKQPDVLILDEPCVGLDDHYRRLVLGFIDRIAGSTATQIIYVSHTEGEEPECINQRLRFVSSPSGGYSLLAR
jgi:molybdate transport system ATP-binding protein